MKTSWLLMPLAAVVLTGASGVVAAAERERIDIGKLEFESKCAICHGRSGKGDGSAVELLKRAPADLTVLSKNNGGVFPFDRVYAVIDGREEVTGHGERDMPIWGKDYQKEGPRAAEYFFDAPYNMEMYVRARILALIDYLHRLQEK